MDSKTLRLVGIGGAAALVAVGGLLFMTRENKPERKSPSEIKRDFTKKPPPQLPHAIPELAVVPDVRVPIRDIDREIIAIIAKTPPDPSVAGVDMLPRSPAKVMILRYGPADGNGVRAVEIDLDRDGTVEENWRVTKDGTVLRDVGLDRTTYHDVWQLEGESWRLKEGRAATAMVVPHTDETVKLRPIDKEIFEITSKPADQSDPRDVLPGPVKVGVQRGVRSKVQGVQVDLDRDGKPDELWSMIGRVIRKVSPADDGNYTEEYELRGDGWVRRN